MHGMARPEMVGNYTYLWEVSISVYAILLLWCTLNFVILSEITLPLFMCAGHVISNCDNYYYTHAYIQVI